MKKALIILIVILLCSAVPACLADEIPEGAISLLKEHCYINPNGGSLLHADRNCENVNPKYRPLTEIEFSEELLDQYSVCAVCTTAEQPQDEQLYDEQWFMEHATFVMSEEDVYRITAEWQKKYGFFDMWDYRVNAAFAVETGTLPYMSYIFDTSLLPVLPDEDAIPAEKIAGDAVSLAASYGSRLTEDDLKNMQVIVAQYRKPDKDVYPFSPTGTWLVNFWDEDESIAWLYVDAHTGIPSYFYIIPDGISYNGEPGVEETYD